MSGPGPRAAVTLAAPAKVNLTLRVLAREASGYHGLETVFQALALADSVTVEAAESGVELEIDSPWPLGLDSENLASEAARNLLDASGAPMGVKISLVKRIPPGGGMGGGSSDAAAALKGLNRLLPEAVPAGVLLELGAELGADVPFFLSPSPLALGWSRGDRLLPLPALPSRPVLVGFPPVSVATGRAYEELALHRKADGREAPPPGILEMKCLTSWQGVADAAVNDFHGPVLDRHPPIAELVDALAESDPSLALLAGSGSSVFAVYRDDESAEKALEELSRDFLEADWRLTRTLERWPDVTA